MLLASLLSHVTDSLERAAEKKSLLLHKIGYINELSRQDVDVDVVIKMCDCQEYVTPSDNIRKRLVNFILLLAHAYQSRSGHSHRISTFVLSYMLKILTKYI